MASLFKMLAFVPLIFMHSCAGFQGVADDIEKIADNDAIIIKVDKDAFSRDTDVHVNVDVLNKEAAPVQVVVPPVK